MSRRIARCRQPASIVFCLLLVWLSVALGACGTPFQRGSATETTTAPYQPVTIQNCGQTLTFTHAPTRVLSTLQTTTDILLALGLGNRLAGIYYGQLYQSASAFHDQYAHLYDLGGDMLSVPSKEKILSMRPDLVFSAYLAGDFLASYGAVTREQFKAQGAQIYGMSGECTEDTTQVRVTSVYDDILNIGRIFGVQARAQQLVNSMKQRIEAVQQRIAHRPQTAVIALPNFSSTQATAPLSVVGAGMYTDLLHLAGGNNLFGTQSKTYPLINQETFAVQKPEAYVLITYQGARPSALTSYLVSTYPESPASRQQRIITIDAYQWNAGVFLPDAIEKLARFFHPEAFQ